MHEFAIASSLVEAATAEARRAGASRVTRLTCRIGVLRQVEEHLLTEAFELARQGSLCESATLTVEKIHMRARCPQCSREYAVYNWEWNSPCCGAEATGVIGGDELDLVSIEAESSPDY